MRRDHCTAMQCTRGGAAPRCAVARTRVSPPTHPRMLAPMPGRWLGLTGVADRVPALATASVSEQVRTATAAEAGKKKHCFCVVRANAEYTTQVDTTKTVDIAKALCCGADELVVDKKTGPKLPSSFSKGTIVTYLGRTRVVSADDEETSIRWQQAIRTCAPCVPCLCMWFQRRKCVLALTQVFV